MSVAEQCLAIEEIRRIVLSAGQSLEITAGLLGWGVLEIRVLLEISPSSSKSSLTYSSNIGAGHHHGRQRLEFASAFAHHAVKTTSPTFLVGVRSALAYFDEGSGEVLM
jgi:hypothetical protein